MRKLKLIDPPDENKIFLNLGVILVTDKELEMCNKLGRTMITKKIMLVNWKRINFNQFDHLTLLFTL